MLLLLVQLFGERPDDTRLALLFVGSVLAMLLAYPVVFLIPGVTFVIGSRWGGKLGVRWSVIYAATFVAEFSLLYLSFIRPNTSPDLAVFWNLRIHPGVLASFRFWGHVLSVTMANHLPVPATVSSPQLLVVLGWFSVAVLVGIVATNFRSSTRNLWEIGSPSLTIASVLAIVVALVAFVSLYPATDRTSLFLLPAWIVVLVEGLRGMSAIARAIPLVRRIRWSEGALLSLVALILVIGPARRLLYAERRPIEDAAGAVAYLQHEVQPSDVLWVHSSASETFKLYADIYGWKYRSIQYGNTGWPCCPRGHSAFPVSSSEQLVREDFEQAVPERFHGRLWLLSSNRAGHWRGLGLDELDVVRQFLRRRGCVEQTAPSFTNMAVIPVRCE